MVVLEKVVKTQQRKTKDPQIMDLNLSFGQPLVDVESNILDIVVPEAMKHAVSTGFKEVDLLFAGDGLVPSTSALITGVPGSGKTTLMIQLANAITRTGNVCVYNVGEESLFQVKRVVERLRLTHGFIPSYHRTAEALIKHVEEVRALYPGKQIFIVQDSLQTLEIEPVLDPETGKRPKGRPPSQDAQSLMALCQLTKFVKGTFDILLMVGHVNKQGEFAGKQTIKHAIDCHLHLALDDNANSESWGTRIVLMKKNRFGVAGVYRDFALTELGVKFGPVKTGI
jgi:DNA repair protein RadA/Sms